MNVKEMTQAIRIAFEAEREPVMLRGAPGIGKSAGMLAACAELAKQLGLKGGVWQWGDPIADGLTIKDYFGYMSCSKEKKTSTTTKHTRWTSTSSMAETSWGTTATGRASSSPAITGGRTSTPPATTADWRR